MDGSGGSPVRFTPRQLEVLCRLLAGDNEKQVARALGISIHTVHMHVKEVYRRVEVNTRGELFTKLFDAEGIIREIRGASPLQEAEPRAAVECNGDPSVVPPEASDAQSSHPDSLPKLIEIGGRLIPQSRLIGVEPSNGKSGPAMSITFLFDARVPLPGIRHSLQRQAWVWRRKGKIAIAIYDELRRTAFNLTAGLHDPPSS